MRSVINAEDLLNVLYKERAMHADKINNAGSEKEKALRKYRRICIEECTKIIDMVEQMVEVQTDEVPE